MPLVNLIECIVKICFKFKSYKYLEFESPFFEIYVPNFASILNSSKVQRNRCKKKCTDFAFFTFCNKEFHFICIISAGSHSALTFKVVLRQCYPAFVRLKAVSASVNAVHIRLCYIMNLQYEFVLRSQNFTVLIGIIRMTVVRDKTSFFRPLSCQSSVDLVDSINCTCYRHSPSYSYFFRKQFQ